MDLSYNVLDCKSFSLFDLNKTYDENLETLKLLSNSDLPSQHCDTAMKDLNKSKIKFEKPNTIVTTKSCNQRSSSKISIKSLPTKQVYTTVLTKGIVKKKNISKCDISYSYDVIDQQKIEPYIVSVVYEKKKKTMFDESDVIMATVIPFKSMSEHEKKKFELVRKSVTDSLMGKMSKQRLLKTEAYFREILSYKLSSKKKNHVLEKLQSIQKMLKEDEK